MVRRTVAIGEIPTSTYVFRRENGMIVSVTEDMTVVDSVMVSEFVPTEEAACSEVEDVVAVV